MLKNFLFDKNIFYFSARKGIKPVTKKIEAFQKIKPPRNKRDLRRFIGMINYYQDMYIRPISHTCTFSQINFKNS